MPKPKFRKKMNKASLTKNKLNNEMRKTEIVGSDGLVKSLGGGPAHTTMIRAYDDYKNALAARKGAIGLIRQVISPRAALRLRSIKRTINADKVSEAKFRKEFIQKHPGLENKVKQLFEKVEKYDKIILESKSGNQYVGLFTGLMTGPKGEPFIYIEKNGKYTPLNLGRIDSCTKR